MRIVLCKLHSFDYFDFFLSTKLVKEHLEVFLKEAQSLKPDAQHVKEVCFLCVQCMEVSACFQHLRGSSFLTLSIIIVAKIQSKTRNAQKN